MSGAAPAPAVVAPVVGGADAALDVATPPAAARARARLALVLVGLGLWLLPWLGAERGPARAGAPAALGFAFAWGTAATALLARTRRGLLVGEALTSALVAGTLAALVALHHPWLPGPDRTATLLPIFGPLAALGVLDAVSRLRRPALGGEVAAIRATAALLCAGALWVAADPLPAVVAVVLALAPAAVVRPVTARGARRGLEALALLAAVALFLAPEAHGWLVAPPVSPESPTVWAFLHPLVAVALAALAVRGLLLPEGADAPTAPR